jgi:hypothetical protein
MRVVAEREIAEDKKAKHWDIVRVYCSESTSSSRRQGLYPPRIDKRGKSTLASPRSHGRGLGSCRKEFLGCKIRVGFLELVLRSLMKLNKSSVKV